MVTFNNHFENKIEVPVTKFDKVDTVERSGYVPLDVQLQQYREAGVLLKSFKTIFRIMSIFHGTSGLEKYTSFTILL